MFQLLTSAVIIGLVLWFAAWIDPFDFGRDFQIVFFILGFDLIPLIPKLVIFGFDFFYDITGLAPMMFILLAEEIVLDVFIIGKVINMVIKPAIVFMLIVINDLPLLLALIIGAIDLLLNMQKKLI